MKYMILAGLLLSLAGCQKTIREADIATPAAAPAAHPSV